MIGLIGFFFAFSSNFQKQLEAIAIFDIIFLLRLLLLADLFQELQQFQILAKVVQQLTTPFLTMALTLYTVYFEYTVLGQFLFGGKISTTSAQTNDPTIPALYYLMNFNDFASGIITLFTLMVINNWFNTTNMLCDVCGNNWPRLFTFSFIMIVVWIMLSVLIAFVLEIHGVVSEEVEKEWKRREWVGNLKNGWSSGGLDVETFKTLTSNAVPLSDGQVLDERMKSVTEMNNPNFESMLNEKQ